MHEHVLARAWPAGSSSGTRCRRRSRAAAAPSACGRGRARAAARGRRSPATVQSASRSAGSSDSGSTPAVTRTPPGVVRSVVVNSPTATLTSRATGSADVHVRRPPDGFDGGSWSPVISTVSRSGAETRSVTSATGLLAVSPRHVDERVARPADPRLPGEQRSPAGPPGHARRRLPRRSKAPVPSDTVKSSSTSVDSPAAELVVQLDHVEAAGIGRARAPRSRRRRRRCPARRRRPGGSPPRRTRGCWAAAGRPARRSAGPGVKTTVCVPVTVRRSSSRRKSRAIDGRSGSGAARSAGQRGRPGSAGAAPGAAAPAGALGRRPSRRRRCTRTAGALRQRPGRPAAATSCQADGRAGQREHLLAAAGDDEVHPCAAVLEQCRRPCPAR